MTLPSSLVEGARVAVYARVSTIKQAEADLSIPDQQAGLGDAGDQR
jgi:hypothetical protein